MIGMLKRFVWIVLCGPLFILSTVTLIPIGVIMFIVTGDADTETAWWFFPLSDWWLS